MSGTIWTRFFWSDWETDQALRLCSFGAQGLWMRLLCIAAAHDPIGYVAVAGRGLDETDIARMTGGTESEVHALLGELDRNGVFSRDRHGRIYSRRMVTDARKAAIAKKNGKSGGNPSLAKDKGNPASDNPMDKPRLKAQEPLSTYPDTSTTTPASASDWHRMVAEAIEAAGDMVDTTRTLILAARDLRPFIEPTSGEPATWDEVLEAIRLTAARQRRSGKLIGSWTWIKDDVWALRDRRLNSAAPPVGSVVTLRPAGGAQSYVDRLTSDMDEATRIAFARMDAQNG